MEKILLTNEHFTVTKNGVSNHLDEEITEILYADLVTLRDNSQLIPGKQYRITDYVTYYYGDDAKSAKHPFDIIVIADDDHTLNEEARAVLHSGDEYFADCNLAAWKVWYKLDDNIPVGGVIMSNEITSKWYARNPEGDVEGATYPYAWIYGSGTTAVTVYTASETPTIGDSAYTATEAEGATTYEAAFTIEEFYLSGKGQIYRLIDENENDVDYDFKNVLWKRYYANNRSELIMEVSHYNVDYDWDWWTTKAFYVLLSSNVSNDAAVICLTPSSSYIKGSDIPTGSYIDKNNNPKEVDTTAAYKRLSTNTFVKLTSNILWCYTFNKSINNAVLTSNVVEQNFANSIKFNVIKESKQIISVGNNKKNNTILQSDNITFGVNSLSNYIYNSSNIFLRRLINRNNIKDCTNMTFGDSSNCIRSSFDNCTNVIFGNTNSGSHSNEVFGIKYAFISNNGFRNNIIHSTGNYNNFVWFGNNFGENIVMPYGGTSRITNVTFENSCFGNIINGYLDNSTIAGNGNIISNILNSIISLNYSEINYIHHCNIDRLNHSKLKYCYYLSVLDVESSEIKSVYDLTIDKNIKDSDIKNCNYLTLTSSQTTSSSTPLRNLEIKGIVGTSESPKVISHNTVNDDFVTTYQPINSKIVNI